MKQAEKYKSRLLRANAMKNNKYVKIIEVVLQSKIQVPGKK